MNLHNRIGVDLASFDRLLREVVSSDRDLPPSSVVLSSVMDLINAGGKRLRPLMVVLGSRFGESGHEPAVMKTAVLLEYLHMASLVHDDIIDQSDMRRGMPTLHETTDVQTAVHIGNYMIARAIEWAAGHSGGDPDGSSEDVSEDEAYRLAELAALVTELCMGEYDQLQHRFDFGLTMEQYLEKTRCKTALLMAHCLKAGAEAAHADAGTAERLFQFGESLGMAFQIRDDLLDFTKPREAIGKPAGADLRNGNITLPVLYALNDPALAPRIRQLGPHSAAADMDDVIHRIAASSAIEQSEELARSYAEHAQRMIGDFADHPAQHDLQALLHYFLP
ncbi:heptaprenyl diphosphate synthase component II [Paenibacillus lautus]|uniref:polyprenyl synthetase family protein n=1 Tax=Paenibacillus lautus TaxID=1401 RepID=UPI001B1496F9|nr:polyprenyl synthetase family protein [Paenibacillus lautus]GIP05736.1 heptaprenyl diphosphate synthase component II [Paenibacillus lautus]